MFVSSKGAKALPVAPREANLQRDPPNRICSWDYNLLVGRKFFWCFITAHYFFPSGSSSCGYVHGIIICCQAAAPKEVRRLQRPISHKRIIRAERGPELYMFMGLQSRSGSGFFYGTHHCHAPANHGRFAIPDGLPASLPAHNRPPYQWPMPALGYNRCRSMIFWTSSR